MTRWTILALGLVFSALAAVAFFSVEMAADDRARLTAQLGEERLRLLRETAAVIEVELKAIGEDLRFAGEVVYATDPGPDRERALGALLAAVRHYRIVELFSASGERFLSVRDVSSEGSFRTDDFDEILRDTALTATTAGQVVPSAPIRGSGGEWYRAFAMSIRIAGTEGRAALLVDTEPLFAKLRLVSSAPATRLLVLGPLGNAGHPSDPALAAAVLTAEKKLAAYPGMRALVSHVAHGQAGVVPIDARESRALGLGKDDLVAAVVPVSVRSTAQWSFAAVASTSAIEATVRANLVRLLFASGVITVSLIGFGAYVVFASRRAVALREQLRHATQLAHLHEKTDLLTSQLLRAEKLSTVGVLAAGVAHEIGTPLGVVRARAEHLLGKLGAESPLAPGARVIVEQIDLVVRTIRQLLDFSRVQAVAVRPTDLGPIARAVRDLLRFEAERRRVSIEVDLPASLPLLSADPDQLQQVLVNLTLNACDACANGGHVRLGARPAPERRGVWIEVADDGCGIPPENHNQVFDPFFTTKKRGQGTGLGLTIAAQIIRNHGGQIELESEVDRGTTVKLLWPAARQQREEHAAAS